MSEYFTLQQYIDADCMQLEPSARVIGIALYHVTQGRMCEGCPKHRNHCESLAKMRPAATPPSPSMGETVREEAFRRSIGIKEVRRQRNRASRGE